MPQTDQLLFLLYNSITLLALTLLPMKNLSITQFWYKTLLKAMYATGMPVMFHCRNRVLSCGRFVHIAGHSPSNNLHSHQITWKTTTETMVATVSSAPMANPHSGISSGPFHEYEVEPIYPAGRMFCSNITWIHNQTSTYFSASNSILLIISVLCTVVCNYLYL